jgi:hypothetical protein
MHVINNSITQGRFPEIFKTAKVIPIYKGGVKGMNSNYRPISFLSVVSKILEKCVSKQLKNYLFENNLICNNQFGFRRDLTSEDALFNLTNEIHEKNWEKINVLF